MTLGKEERDLGISSIPGIGPGFGVVKGIIDTDKQRGSSDRQFHNAWTQQRYRYGIDESPYRDELKMPERWEQEAQQAYLRARYNPEHEDVTAAQMDGSQRAYLQAAQNLSAPSNYDAIAEAQRQQASARVQSQLASQRGPTAAAQRRAQYLQSGMQQTMAGQNALNAAQHENARRLAAAQELAQVRQNAQQGMSQRRGAVIGRGKHALGQEHVWMGQAGLGTNAEQNRLARGMQLQQLKPAIIQPEEGLEISKSAAARQQGQQAGAASTAVLGNVLMAVGNNKTSDVRAKQDIEPADDDIRAYLDALGGR